MLAARNHHMLMIIKGTYVTSPSAEPAVILSKSSEYAVRAILCLSERDRSVPVPVDEIAAALGIPRNYLSKILHELARTEILDSTRGPRGGFALSIEPEELTLADIVGNFDAIPDETTCLLGRTNCSEVDSCRAHDRWAVVRAAIIDFLTGTRVADLAGTPLFAKDVNA